MSVAATKSPNYFMYFPDNYRWSAEMLAILGTAPYGGAEIAEADRIGRQLKGRVGDDSAWFDAWTAGGDLLLSRAQSAESKGHLLTAASNYLRACSQYQHAEHFRQPKDDAAFAVFRRSLDCFGKYRALIDRPRIEAVEIPYENGALPAYFIHAENTKAARTPCVVRFGGFDTQKELQYVRGVADLVRRGFSCLLVDGPGMGESIRFRGIHLHANYEWVGTACLDYLATRPDVAMDRVGVVALSLGGYFAPRCASLDPRFKACVAWGAMWDFHRIWKTRIERITSQQNVSMPAPAEHFLWVFGEKTYEAALKKTQGFILDGVVQNMRCPFLLTHGTDDEQVPLADAQKLFDAVGSSDKTFRIFSPEEGGAQHCQRDYLTLVCDTIADWLEEKL